MALYEYDCKNGHSEEIIRNVSDRRKPLKCPECGEPMSLVEVHAPALRIPLQMKERLNQNWQKRKELKATGEW